MSDNEGCDPILERRPLTRRQRLFVEFYLQTWNATEAARLAGFKHPNMQGPRLMVHDSISARIRERESEIAMNTDEILTRLTQQARNEAADYISEDGTVDLPRLIADGKQYLIRGIKYTNKGRMMVEFLDPQAALVLLGKHRQLFTDKLDVTSGGEKLPAPTVNVYIPDNGRGDRG